MIRRITARPGAVRYGGILRFCPPVIVAAGFWLTDPDAAERMVTLLLAVASCFGLGLLDRRRAAAEADTEDLRATVEDWDAALRAAGLVRARRMQVLPPSG